MTEPTAKRLRAAIDAQTRVVRILRALDTEYREEDDEATFDAKLALTDLDTGLVAPRFWGLAILTYTPEAAASAGVAAMLDALAPLDATARAARIAEIARRDGPLAVHEAAKELAASLRAWAETTSTIPEVADALAAYCADPYPLNALVSTTEAI